MATNAEIGKLWDRVIMYGLEVRSGGCDGLDSWNALKSVLLRYSTPIEWSDECMQFYEHLLATGLIENYDEDKIDRLTWERHHFLLQHGRIPHRNPKDPTSVQLLQIGFNCGQMSSDQRSSATSTYTIKQLELYNTMNMNCVETYLKVPICLDPLVARGIIEEISQLTITKL